MFNPLTKIISMLAQRKLEKIHKKFMDCICANDIDGAQKYLNGGLNPNFGPSDVGYFVAMNELPPLFAAAKMWLPQMVQLLLDHGTDPVRTLTEGGDMGSSPYHELPQKNVLEMYIQYMGSIDSGYAHPRQKRKYPVEPETALQVYKVLRSKINPSEKDLKTINEGKGRSLPLFAAWEQQQLLQKYVPNIHAAPPPRRM